MLVTLKEVTQDALKNHYAVGAYNIHNLEYAKAVVETSYEMKAPVILQISQGSSDFAGLEELCMIARHYAGKYAIPVVVHLDHGKSFLRCVEGLRAGFSSVMFDGSSLPYAENVAITRQVVEAAHQVSVAVEAEIGKVGKSEDGASTEAEDMHYTAVDEAVRFVGDTHVDALAVSIGTVHAMAVQAAHLDIALCRKLHEAMPTMPLVMHGASGAVDEDVQQDSHQIVQHDTVHLQDFSRALVLLFDQASSFSVDRLGGLLTVVALLTEFLPEEHQVAGLAIGKGTEFLTHAICTNHAVNDVRGTLEIVRRSGRDTSQEEFLRSTSTEQAGNVPEEFLAGTHVSVFCGELQREPKGHAA